MGRGPNYTVIPNDWQNLEYIISDLCNRVIDEDASFSDYLLKDGTRALTGNWDAGNYSITIGTLTLTSGSITDSGGNISFGNENILTTGTIGTGQATITKMNLGGGITAFVLNGVSLNAIVGATSQIATELQYVALQHSNVALAGSRFMLSRSRGTLAAPLIVAENDSIAAFDAAAYDGTDYVLAGEIDFEVDGTPGGNDMPGRIVFKTTADGGVLPAAKWTIKSTGHLLSGTDGTGAYDITTAGTGQFIKIGVGTTPQDMYGAAITEVNDGSGTIAGIYGGGRGTRYIGAKAVQVSAIYGLQFSANYVPSDLLQSDAFVTAINTTKTSSLVESQDSETKDITVTSLTGFSSEFTLETGDSATGAITVADAAIFRAVNPTITTGAGSATPTITLLSAFYDPGMTAGATNWGLAINTQSYINASLRLGSAVAPTAVLDVTGDAKISTTLEIGTPPTYTPSNVTPDRSFDADTVAVAELADVVGTLIADLQTMGLVN